MNCHHGDETKDFLLNCNLVRLKGISNTLPNLTFVQLRVDEIAGRGGALLGIKCGSEIASYKKV